MESDLNESAHFGQDGLAVNNCLNMELGQDHEDHRSEVGVSNLLPGLVGQSDDELIVTSFKRHPQHLWNNDTLS